MKKRNIIVMGLMMISTLTFTNCENIELSFCEAEALQQDGTPFSITLASEDVKTTNDGMSTLWALSDGVTVFHRENGTSGAYLGNDKFTANQAGASSPFTGTLKTALEDGKSYDWYVVYPWKANLTDLVGPSNAKHNMGLTLQERSLADKSMLCGSEFLMYGTATDVASDETPVITMKHMSGVACVKVYNDTDYPLNLSSIVLTAPEGTNICGKFQIDFTTVPPTYSNPDAGSNSNSIFVNTKTLSVAAHANISVYVQVLPFTVPNGQDLKLAVNGLSKTVTASSDLVFSAGKIKTLNFHYDYSGIDNGEYFITSTGEDGQTYMAHASSHACFDVEGKGGTNKVLFSHTARFDESNIFYDSNLDIAGEGATDITSNLDGYKFTITRVTEGEYAGMYTIQDPDGKYMSANLASTRQLEFLDAISGDTPADSYWDIARDNASGNYEISATKSLNFRFFRMNYNNGDLPRFIVFNATDAPKFTSVQLRKVSDYTTTLDPLPRFGKTDNISVISDGVTDAEVANVFLNNNGWNVTVTCDGTIVTAASITGSTLTYSVAANSASSPRNGSITVTLTDPNGIYTEMNKVITVAQDACLFYTKVTDNKASWVGRYLIVYESSATTAKILRSDVTNMTNADAGNQMIDAAITLDGIKATALINTNTFEIRAHAAGTGSGVVYTEAKAGKYTIFLNNGNGYGIYGRNMIVKSGNFNPTQWNDNVDASRFVTSISYDSTNSCMNVSCTTKESGEGYLGYNTTVGAFRWNLQIDYGTYLEHIQFYELVTPGE